MRRPARAAPRALLLDTCAVIWLANRDALADGAWASITYAANADGLFVSPVSAWEIGLLSRQKTGRAMDFLPDPATWFARMMAAPGIRSAPLTDQIAIASSFLPSPLHGDPADRLLIATARDLGLPIVTRDPEILAYARAGHVAAVAC
ncbi:MAG: type II toxin-antitoxin system VapC family toxin [Caulobacteraceae bacterium]